MEYNKWPKIFAPLTPEQEAINHDFVQYWHKVLANSRRYSLIEKFNHSYVMKHTTQPFLHTLEIGAGLGEHLKYEHLTPEQKKNYVALELRENMAAQIGLKFSDIKVEVGDCQQRLPYPDNYFDRIIAIHVLEHLPNLPAAVQEMHRICHKESGSFSIVIPCEGGVIYNLARQISAKRVFEKRYNQSYKWFIAREHVNKPAEIINELEKYFSIEHQTFYPFFIPSINLNLCIGLKLLPKKLEIR